MIKPFEPKNPRAKIAEESKIPAQPPQEIKSKAGVKDRKGGPKAYHQKPKEQPQIERSSFLLSLIEKIQAKEEFDYRIIRSHVYECAIDQQGSRFI